MIQIHSNGVVPDGNVISAESYQAYVEGQEIIGGANQQANAILVEAKREANRLREDGYEQGLKDGQVEMAGKMLETVEKHVEYLSEMEAQVVSIVTKAIRKVIGEIEQHDLISRVVAKALGVARDQSKAKLRVCPAEVETVRFKIDDLLRPYPTLSFVDVISDTRLSPGDCILETDIGVVDASVEVQIEAIEQTLANSLGVTHS
ncbi:MAG: HrpE/YscL family type III secretion apparatus protein [Planctomycetota bacterium]